METLDVVNANDTVISQASQEEVYRKRLEHRIVHVLVFNAKHELALQLRSDSKSFCPGCWLTTDGGHVQAGETYEQAALREMREEIGIQTNLSLLGKDLYVVPSNKGLRKHLATFTAKHSGPFSCNPTEVAAVKFFNLAEVQRMVERGEKFHPELHFILTTYYCFAS